MSRAKLGDLIWSEYEINRVMRALKRGTQCRQQRRALGNARRLRTALNCKVW